MSQSVPSPIFRSRSLVAVTARLTRRRRPSACTWKPVAPCQSLKPGCQPHFVGQSSPRELGIDAGLCNLADRDFAPALSAQEMPYLYDRYAELPCF